MNRYLGALAVAFIGLWLASQTTIPQQLRTAWSRHTNHQTGPRKSPERECSDSLGIYIDRNDDFILARGLGQFTAEVIAQGRLGREGAVIDTSKSENSDKFDFWRHAQSEDTKKLTTAFDSLFARAGWDRTCVASLVLLPSMPLTDRQKQTLQKAATLEHKLILTDLGATIYAFDIQFSSGDISSLAVVSEQGAVTLKKFRDPERCSGWRMRPQEYPPPVDVDSLLAFNPDSIFDQVIAVDIDVPTSRTTPFLRRVSTEAIALGAAIEVGRNSWRYSLVWNAYVRLASTYSVGLSPSSMHNLHRYEKQGQLKLTTSRDNQERVAAYILRDEKPVARLELNDLTPRAAGQTEFIVSFKASWEGRGVNTLVQLVDLHSGQRSTMMMETGWSIDGFETIPLEYDDQEQLALAPTQNEDKPICGGHCNENKLTSLKGSLLSDSYSLSLMDDDEDKAELQREMNETERKIAELEEKIRAKGEAFERAL